MNNVQIDLETLGTAPGSVILSIGAVLFDANGIGKEFYCVVSKDSCLMHGLTIDQSTLDWWKKQSDEARKVLIEAESPDALSLTDALERLARFIPANARIWSNGANFDQPLLDVAYRALGQSVPWKYFNSRCYRTILALCPTEKSMRPATVCAHNALEDAKWQAIHMGNVVRHLGLSI